MKTSLILTPALFLALLAQSALAANPCGEPAGTYTDSSTNGYFQRTISRFNKDGHYFYSYSFDPGTVMPKEAADNMGYEVVVSLDGKTTSTHGSVFCTSVAVQPISDGKCVDESDSGSFTTYSSVLFYFSTNGDHLNVWEGNVTVLNPFTSKPEQSTSFYFPEKKFSDMKFQ